MQFLLAVTKYFGDVYLSNIMLPVFLLAVGEEADLKLIPPNVSSRIKGRSMIILLVKLYTVFSLTLNFKFTIGLRPKTAVAEALSIMGVLPILLAGVLGAPSMSEQLAEFLRKILVHGIGKGNHTTRRITEIVDAARFLWLVF